MSSKTSMSRREMLFGAFRRVRGEGDGGAARQAQAMARPKARDDMGLALKAMKAGDLDKAVTHFSKAIKVDPSNADARIRYGMCLYRLGKFIQARVEFDRVRRLRKDDNTVCLYQGLCLLRLEKTDKGLETLKEYFDPRAPDIMREVNLQRALVEEGQAPSATDMAKAIEEVLGLVVKVEG